MQEGFRTAAAAAAAAAIVLAFGFRRVPESGGVFLPAAQGPLGGRGRWGRDRGWELGHVRSGVV